MNPPFLSPAFRSRRFGHRQLTAGKLAWIGLSTLLVPPVVMILLGLPFLLFGEAFDNPALQSVGIVTGLGVVTPFVGIYAVPMALLVGAWAMRFGVAGWGAALLTALLLPVTLGALYQLLDPTSAAIGAMAILTPIVLLHAAVLWAATRYFCPASLIE